MSGNVKEWCWDIYSFYEDLMTGNVKDPVGIDGVKSRDSRALRGGSWMDDAEYFNHIAARNSSQPYINKYQGYGFRVARRPYPNEQ
jgi:formylglycine-generating enzyme required for sulfatase activity